MKKRRVVITGLGIVCPVGNTIAEAWCNILNGNSGIASLENIDTEGQAVTFGGSVKNFDVSNYLSPKEAKKMDIFIHYGMAAGIQAIEDSGIEVTESNADRIGVAIGAGIGGLTTIEKTADLFREKAPREFHRSLYLLLLLTWFLVIYQLSMVSKGLTLQLLPLARQEHTISAMLQGSSNMVMQM